MEDEFRIKKNYWKEEDHIDMLTLQKKIMHVSRIIFVPVDDKLKGNPDKRCISITKGGHSVAFDIEMAKSVASAILELGDEYVPLG